MEASYKFRTVGATTGKITEGSLKANSKDEAINILKSKNQIPIQITEESIYSKDIKSIKLFKKKVKTKDLSIFCRQLSAMLNSGMPINRALDIQVAQTVNPVFKEALLQVSESIKRGESLLQAMRAHPTVFPPILLSMIEAGEATGKLDDVLSRMSTHYIKEAYINNKVKGAMTYPLVLSVLTVVIVTIMMVFVIPMFVEMFESANAVLPLLTRIMIGISNSIMKFWYIHCAVVFGVVYGTKRYLATETGKYKFDKLKLGLPIIKKSMSQIITARFTRTLSTLLQSGIPIVKAIQIAGDTTNNVIVNNALLLALDGIKRGMPLNTELRKISVFPDMMVSMVSIGEETGNIDDLLLKTADYYDTELDEGIQKLLSLLEPLMIIIIAIIVGLVVVSIMLPMFSMGDAMGQ